MAVVSTWTWVPYTPPITAYRCVAKTTTASTAVPTTPTPVVPTANSGTDPLFNAATGTIGPFPYDVLWSSTVSVNPSCSSGTPVYYTDAEFSTDGGSTWTRGTDSLRAEELAANYIRTREFSFSGKFSAGTTLRFVEWASAVGIVLTTSGDTQGSTIPARRITYTYVPANIA